MQFGAFPKLPPMERMFPDNPADPEALPSEYYRQFSPLNKAVKRELDEITELRSGTMINLVTQMLDRRIKVGLDRLAAGGVDDPANKLVSLYNLGPVTLLRPTAILSRPFVKSAIPGMGTFGYYRFIGEQELAFSWPPLLRGRALLSLKEENWIVSRDAAAFLLQHRVLEQVLAGANEQPTQVETTGHSKLQRPILHLLGLWQQK